jgi:acetylornithine deacetylase/succinyl-diaminopimelate desuccinylase-like protein
MAEATAGTVPVVDDLALEEVVRFTSDLIRIDTTNRGGGEGNERPAAEYVAAWLADAGIEPVVLESAPGRANVVARVPGTDPTAGALLVHGHLDVVPAEAADWTVPPFSGEVRDGVVWGRGAIDMKDMDAMVLATVRAWARSGQRPARDIVLAFTADEEDSAAYGSGFLAGEHAGLFEGCTEGISESGAFTFHAGDLRIYPVAAGERGTAWLKLTARGTAGHGSKVNHDNAVAHLAAAVARIAAHRWPVRLTGTVRAALTELAALLGVPAGLDDVDALLDRLGPAAALVRPTVRNSANPTMFQAGYKVNVIPGSATAYVDGRVVPGGEEEFTATLDRLTGPDVAWEYHHREVPLEAPADSPTYRAMREALEHFDPGAHVVPYCMSGGTDAKQFSRLGITGYGFSPLRLPPGFDYHALFHGVDERVPVDALHFGVRVLDRFLRGVPGASGPDGNGSGGAAADEGVRTTEGVRAMAADRAVTGSAGAGGAGGTGAGGAGTGAGGMGAGGAVAGSAGRDAAGTGEEARR